MPRTLAHALACLAVAAVLFGPALHGRDEQDRPQATPASLSEITDEVVPVVEKLRGWAFLRPVPRQRVDAPTARAYFEKQVERAWPAERRRLLEALLRLAGLIPNDCDLRAVALESLEAAVGGYYDPGVGSLYLIDRERGLPAFVEKRILAHELTHALDDQHVGIGRLLEHDGGRTQDSELVLRSLGEGSATALTLHFALTEAAVAKPDPKEILSFASGEATRTKTLAPMPRYFTSSGGAYVIGAAFLTKGDLIDVCSSSDDRAIGENFRTAWATPPRSTEQILHPEKYWDESRRDEPVIVDDQSAEAWLAGPRRQVVYRDTLGELLTAALTEPRNFPKDNGRSLSATAWTNPGAIGWGGDRFFVLASGRTRADATRTLAGVRGAWVTAWDGRWERGRFLSALERGFPPPGYAVEKLGDKVAIVFMGLAAAERAALMRRLRAFPLSFRQAGQPWKP